MPNKRELQSLMDYSFFDPSLPPDHPFKNIVSDNYWTSTNGASDKNGAALVGFYYGFDAFAFKFTNHFVSAVRGGM